ncbi:hypothetical protein Misp02_63580 [Microtetraspora sp. NBRC 16547]|nr:hypothetical protein Misp02_63580 [Microtetraspora sp. NBRC 16547]
MATVAGATGAVRAAGALGTAWSPDPVPEAGEGSNSAAAAIVAAAPVSHRIDMIGTLPVPACTRFARRLRRGELGAVPYGVLLGAGQDTDRPDLLAAVEPPLFARRPGRP